VICAHTDADLQNILAGSLPKPGEVTDIRLQVIARLRVLAEPLFGGAALRIDLAARLCVPESADFRLTRIHAHVSARLQMRTIRDDGNTLDVLYH
jgi:hypothetical protein